MKRTQAYSVAVLSLILLVLFCGQILAVSAAPGESPPSVTTTPATSLLPTSATLNGNLTSTGGAPCTVSFEYGLTTAYGDATSFRTMTSSGLFNQSISGLSPNTTYHYRARANNSAGTTNGADQTFTTDAEPPIVTTLSATSLLPTSATLNGNLTSTGGAPCGVSFEYYPDTSYEDVGTAPVTSPPGLFNQSISGLSPNTTYHYRAVASNSAGTTKGPYMTFTTQAAAPAVITLPVDSPGPTSATLNGNLTSTGGAPCTVFFQYGLTTAYGDAISFGTMTLPGPFSQPVSGLTPGTTYHYRAAANNSAGTTNGPDMTFTTMPPTPTGGGGGGGSIYDFTGTGTLLTSSEGKVLRTTTITSENGVATLTLPQGTIALAGDDKPVGEITIGMINASDLPPAPDGATFAFAGYACECSPAGATFSPAIPLTFTLTADEWEAFGGDLSVRFYDDETGDWVDVPVTVDAAAHTVTAEVSHFSIFALFAEAVESTAAQDASTPASTTTATPATPAPTVTAGDITGEEDSAKPEPTPASPVVFVPVAALGALALLWKKR